MTSVVVMRVPSRGMLLQMLHGGICVPDPIDAKPYGPISAMAASTSSVVA
jgi:hypothetical protein